MMDYSITQNMEIDWCIILLVLNYTISNIYQILCWPTLGSSSYFISHHNCENNFKCTVSKYFSLLCEVLFYYLNPLFITHLGK